MDYFNGPIPYDDETKRYINILALDQNYDNNNYIDDVKVYNITNCSNLDIVNEIE